MLKLMTGENKRTRIMMPTVSVIVPCFNEEDTIHLLLEALYAQTYPRRQMEVLIADGMSTDRTRERIHEFHQAHPDFAVKVVNNPPGTIPSGLNRAIEAASGEFIVRLDAHAVPQPDYVARCQDALELGLGDNVGGVWEIRPRGRGWQARSIAMAAAHPLAVGDAYYRYADRPQAVDTVPFGAFRRSLVERIGPFDETLLTNEDYEFNTRIRQAGGTVWLDPAIRSIYFSRASYSELARQYWRYGHWKARMLRKYPETLRWRQALPPLFILSLLGGLVLSFWSSLVRWIFVIELASYALVLFLVGIQMGIKYRDIALIVGVPLAIATMHLSWGSAFLWSLFKK
jgi:glycosyltransferase involved in cell wall biosynthesis